MEMQVENKPPSSRKPEQFNKSTLARFAGLGIQLATTLLIAGFLGYWLDEKFHTSPLFILLMILASFVGMMYKLFQIIK